MKALTIRQPWASLIVLGVKTVETRSWPTKYRGPIAIHAGTHLPVNAYPLISDLHRDGRWLLKEYGPDGALLRSEEMPLGAVIATAEVVDCVPITECAMNTHHLCADGGRVLEHWPLDGRHPDETECDHGLQAALGDYTPGRWAWLLEDVQPITPVCAKGRLGLWEWQP